jgi:hypothetical protein
MPGARSDRPSTWRTRRRIMFSASSETRDRNAPTNANQIGLQNSGIRQEHRPIRYQLPARLSFRQGQRASGIRKMLALLKRPKRGCC